MAETQPVSWAGLWSCLSREIQNDMDRVKEIMTPFCQSFIQTCWIIPAAAAAGGNIPQGRLPNPYGSDKSDKEGFWPEKKLTGQ